MDLVGHAGRGVPGHGQGVAVGALEEDEAVVHGCGGHRGGGDAGGVDRGGGRRDVDGVGGVDPAVDGGDDGLLAQAAVGQRDAGLAAGGGAAIDDGLAGRAGWVGAHDGVARRGRDGEIRLGGDGHEDLVVDGDPGGKRHRGRGGGAGVAG